MTQSASNPPPSPHVSVVMPTHTRAGLLGRSIASVLGQSFADLELIVVDDCSSDNTAEVVARFDDPRLRYVPLTDNLGAAGARNAGARLARGEWLAFQDDDDIWLVDKLRCQIETLREQPEAQWCLGSFIQIQPQRQIYFGGEAAFRGMDYRQGIGDGGPQWNLIATPNWLLRRSLFEQAGGFDPEIRSWDDWELGLRLYQLSPPIHCDQPTFIQDHIEGSGLMRAERTRAADMRRILAKHGHYWDAQPRVMARHYYQIGRAESLYDPAPAGRDALWRSLALRPLAPRTLAALVLAYLPGELGRRLTQGLRKLKQGFRR